MASSDYETAFNKIVAFTSKRRTEDITRHEINCTRELAGPFTPGGILVLLQEPLPDHPWIDGIDAVISQCSSLSLLREAVFLGSSGNLNLEKDVSVLDRWPMHDKKTHVQLQNTHPAKMDELNYLLRNAIIAKNPEVIICMGTVS